MALYWLQRTINVKGSKLHVRRCRRRRFDAYSTASVVHVTVAISLIRSFECRMTHYRVHYEYIVDRVFCSMLTGNCSTAYRSKCVLCCRIVFSWAHQRHNEQGWHSGTVKHWTASRMISHSNHIQHIQATLCPVLLRWEIVCLLFFFVSPLTRSIALMWFIGHFSGGHWK